MENSKYIVDKVDSFQVPAQDPNAIVRTHSNGDYQVAKNDPLIEVWSSMISDYRAEGRPLYIEFDPATLMIKEIFQPVMRRIRHLAQEVRDKRVNVVLLMAPSMYHIKTTRANYEEMRRQLEESMKSGSPVLVTSHPDTQEILDVRRP